MLELIIPLLLHPVAETTFSAAKELLTDTRKQCKGCRHNFTISRALGERGRIL